MWQWISDVLIDMDIWSSISCSSEQMTVKANDNNNTLLLLFSLLSHDGAVSMLLTTWAVSMLLTTWAANFSSHWTQSRLQAAGVKPSEQNRVPHSTLCVLLSTFTFTWILSEQTPWDVNELEPEDTRETPASRQVSLLLHPVTNAKIKDSTCNTTTCNWVYLLKNSIKWYFQSATPLKETWDFNTFSY